MAAVPHPVTGLLLNEISVIRKGPVSATERHTAELLQAEGDARWLAAARLGRFPLAFSGTGRSPADRRPRLGAGMRTSDARRDPRQISLIEVLDTADDRTGTED